MKKHGFLTARHEGEMEVELWFHPHELKVAFCDDEPLPPTCTHVPHDYIHIETLKPTRPGARGLIRIRWRVRAERRARWEAHGSFF